MRRIAFEPGSAHTIVRLKPSLPGIFQLALRNDSVADERRKRFGASFSEHLATDADTLDDLLSACGKAVDHANLETHLPPVTSISLSISIRRNLQGREIFDALWPLHEPTKLEIRQGWDKEMIWETYYNRATDTVSLVIPSNFCKAGA